MKDQDRCVLLLYNKILILNTINNIDTINNIKIDYFVRLVKNNRC